MEIVINDCFGGFGLSTEAMKRLIGEGSGGVKIHDLNRFTGGRGKGEFPREKYKDAGDGFEVGWISDVLYKGENVYTYDDNNRTDPVLVKLVKEMGVTANADCARLKIVEIPDGVEWTIHEYDGKEHIAEKHRTWS